MQPGDDRPFKDWVLEKETELRLEVGYENTIDLQACACMYTVTCGHELPLLVCSFRFTLPPHNIYSFYLCLVVE